MASLATRFGRTANVLRAASPLSDDQIRSVAPSIFAEHKHASRSGRYAYIPTIEVLRGLRKEGFEPFLVCQSRTRDESRREHTKHLLRLRHAGQINGEEANEIILLNSHDGTSAYQMLAGTFRLCPAVNSRNYVSSRTMSCNVIRPSGQRCGSGHSPVSPTAL